MTTKTKPGKEQRFATALKQGKSYTRKQATSMFKLGNPSATVARLEQNHGMNINRDYKTDTSGNVISVRYSVKARRR